MWPKGKNTKNIFFKSSNQKNKRIITSLSWFSNVLGYKVLCNCDRYIYYICNFLPKYLLKFIDSLLIATHSHSDCQWTVGNINKIKKQKEFDNDNYGIKIICFINFNIFVLFSIIITFFYSFYYFQHDLLPYYCFIYSSSSCIEHGSLNVYY